MSSGTIVADLSGGRDSRLVAAAALAAGLTVTLNTGGVEPGEADVAERLVAALPAEAARRVTHQISRPTITGPAPTFGLAAVAVLVGHMGAGSQWSFSSYGLQRYAADEVKGRIFGLDFAAVTATSTVSQLMFGWLAEEIPVRILFAWIAAVAVVFGLVWWRATRRYWV